MSKSIVANLQKELKQANEEIVEERRNVAFWSFAIKEDAFTPDEISSRYYVNMINKWKDNLNLSQKRVAELETLISVLVKKITHAELMQ